MMRTILLVTFSFSFVFLASLMAQSDESTGITNSSPRGLPGEKRPTTVIEFEGGSLQPKDGVIKAEITTRDDSATVTNSTPVGASSEKAKIQASAEERARQIVPVVYQIVKIEDLHNSDVKGPNGLKLRMIRVQFKMIGDLTSLEVAKVYLYDQNKKLVSPLTDFVTATLSAHAPANSIERLQNLDKNKVYNLDFIYPGNMKWKYAVSVLGIKDKVIARTLPSGETLDQFAFSEIKYLTISRQQ